MTTAFRIAMGLLALLLMGACTDGGQSPGESGAQATALLRGVDSTEMGEVALTEGPNGVLVSGETRGLSPGAHGFHIHAIGACESDFAAAGDHFNPGELEHGLLHEGGAHVGDLPNIHAKQDGVARADFFTTAVTLGRGADHSLFDADGIGVHRSRPTG